MYKYEIKLELYNGDEEVLVVEGKNNNFYTCALDENDDVNRVIMERDDFEYYSFKELF